jgi:DsbC/DsbD-like thiol-disulfide interchange protein
LGLAIAPFAQAQLEVPKVVSGRAVLAKSAVRAGEPVKLALVLKIDKGWHINSDDPGDEFMFPSAVIVDESQGFALDAVAFPEPKRATYEYSDFELRVYEGEAVIGALLLPAADLKPGALKLTVKFKYQACNDSSCIMPQDLPFEIPVEVVAAGVETKDVEPELFVRIAFKAKD